jgi:hypothetical protein
MLEPNNDSAVKGLSEPLSLRGEESAHEENKKTAWHHNVGSVDRLPNVHE